MNVTMNLTVRGDDKQIVEVIAGAVA